MKKRFTEEQIIGVLKEQKAKGKTLEVCRRYGISPATFYKWKAKFGGMEVSDARRLRALEAENARLKKLLAETMLDNAMLKDVTASRAPSIRSYASDCAPSPDSDGDSVIGVWRSFSHAKGLCATPRKFGVYIVRSS